MVFSVNELQVFSKGQHSGEVLEIPHVWQKKPFFKIVEIRLGV
jgi:hypothetical protein